MAVSPLVPAHLRGARRTGSNLFKPSCPLLVYMVGPFARAARACADLLAATLRGRLSLPPQGHHMHLYEPTPSMCDFRGINFVS